LVLDFDTTVNSSLTDISGQGNNPTFGFVNGASYSAPDKAFNFDGTNDFIDIGTLTGVGTGAWVHSKSFWFKIRSSTDPGVLFLLGRSNSNTRQIAVQVNGSGEFQYFIYGCNAKVQVNGSDWYPDVNRWYHCVTVFRNNETTATGGVITGREMYIDGVKQTLVAKNTQVSLDLNTTGVRFGNQFNTVYLNYQLSNPKLYSVALEPSEVKKLYNLGRTGRSMVISDTAVGIGKVPEAQLDVRGAIRGVNMTTCPVYFDVSWSTSQSTGVNILFNVFHVRHGGAFEPTTLSTTGASREFYAPITGHYYFSFYGMGGFTSGNNQTWVTFRRNGSDTNFIGNSNHVNSQRIYDNYNSNGDAAQQHRQISGAAIIALNAGDYLQIHVEGGNHIHSYYGRFQGFFLSPY
jgi:hypothetical protein